MNNYATITPDRGDRAPFMKHCVKQISRLEPAYIITVLYPPVNDHVDLVPRIRHGIEIAKRNGYDIVYIIESDDYYPANYFELMPIGDHDIIGYQNTFYYNLKNLSYSHLSHESHSSLFCTAFRISAFEKFPWPHDEFLWLDIAMWKYAIKTGLNYKLLRDDNPCLGIKHGMGKTGGKAHKTRLAHPDDEMKWLKSKVDNESFEFYSELRNNL